MLRFVTLIAGILCIWSGAFCQSTVDKDMLLIQTRTGRTVSFRLDGYPRMSLVDDTVQLTAGSTTVSYPMADIAKMAFDSAASLAPAAAQTDVEISLSGSTLTVVTSGVGCPVTVFGISGAKVAETQTGADGHCTLDLGGLPSGVYIVNAGSFSHKLLK